MFVRYNREGEVIAGSNILAKRMPKIGYWKEIQLYQCCNYTASEE
jgi:hypothetical protein